LELAIANTLGERAYLHDTLTNEEFVAWWFSTLVSAATCVKHEGFYEEREWRVVYTTALSTSRLLEHSTEVVQGVPQKVYKVPLDVAASPELASLDLANILQRVIVGPTAYPWVMYEAFVEALTKAGVPNPSERVWVSDIPLRE
jgi:hypothetical protein